MRRAILPIIVVSAFVAVAAGAFAVGRGTTSGGRTALCDTYDAMARSATRSAIARVSSQEQMHRDEAQAEHDAGLAVVVPTESPDLKTAEAAAATGDNDRLFQIYPGLLTGDPAVREALALRADACQ